MPPYTYITIDVPGAMETAAWGINENGQVVGIAWGHTGNPHGFLKDGTTYTTFDAPGSLNTTAFAVNNNGQIVGLFTDATAMRNYGFLKDGPTFTTIDIPGATETAATGINTAGQIVGYWQDANRRYHGFPKDGETFTLFNGLRPWGINDNGQIVGEVGTAGFLMDGATFTTITVPDSTTTIAFAINSEGQVVGQFADGTRNYGFLKDGPTFTTIDIPDSTIVQATGINASGQIVGAFSENIAGSHGFLATPVDTTPPVLSVSASPATLSPPNGRLVTVPVSGTITDEPDGSGVQASTYQVIDEYG
jgi:probable HAF family extracellular repeat protein